ncbi:hypothetical protein TNCV_1449011 [Trichonephila clavipes]|nr:hypothetical protein TNCV_1449011 [Trichonephila clavipes]
MPRGRHRASFDRVSEFDRGIIIANSKEDGWLPYQLRLRIILQRNRSMCWTKPSNCDADLSLLDAEENGGSDFSPRCTTSRADRWFVRMAVMDRAETSRNLAQQIQSDTHNSEFTRTI